MSHCGCTLSLWLVRVPGVLTRALWCLPNFRFPCTFPWCLHPLCRHPQVLMKPLSYLAKIAKFSFTPSHFWPQFLSDGCLAKEMILLVRKWSFLSSLQAQALWLLLRVQHILCHKHLLKVVKSGYLVLRYVLLLFLRGAEDTMCYGLSPGLWQGPDAILGTLVPWD